MTELDWHQKRQKEIRVDFNCVVTFNNLTSKIQALSPYMHGFGIVSIFNRDRVFGAV